MVWFYISELAEKRVAKVTDVVKEGDEVSVKVLGFDRGKVKLSIKTSCSLIILKIYIQNLRFTIYLKFYCSIS